MRSAVASTSWWERRAESKTICRTTSWICLSSNTWFWTRWTRCWTWASLNRWRRSCLPPITKVIYSRGRIRWSSSHPRAKPLITTDLFLSDAEEKPQTLLFSATCPSWVYEVAKKYMRSQFIHVDLIGKRTQKAATTVEVTERWCLVCSGNCLVRMWEILLQIGFLRMILKEYLGHFGHFSWEWCDQWSVFMR